MSELTRRPCTQKNETFYDSHVKVETDVNNNSGKDCFGKGSVRKRDVLYALLHAFTAVALIHAYTHINYLSGSNKDAGQGFSTFIS